MTFACFLLAPCPGMQNIETSAVTLEARQVFETELAVTPEDLINSLQLSRGDGGCATSPILVGLMNPSRVILLSCTAGTVLAKANTGVGLAESGMACESLDGHNPIARILCQTVALRAEDVGSKYRYEVRAVAADDGASVYRFIGDAAQDCAGYDICNVGDTNGDGHEDLIVGAPQRGASVVESPGPGYVVCLSGRSGKVLYRVPGDQLGAAFGWSIARAGDLDKDGVIDYVVGAPGIKSLKRGDQALQGYADVLSGKDGHRLFRVKGPTQEGTANPQTQFGWSVAAGKDVDGDGVGDIVVGDPGAQSNVVVFSGATGKKLYSIECPQSQGADVVGFGRAIDLASDIDNDGRAELLVGNPNADGLHRDEGAVFVFSGKGGSELGRISGKADGEQIGELLLTCGGGFAGGEVMCAVATPRSVRGYVLTMRMVKPK
ncbi:MAG: integrin alpha [Planctomycetota bacterium]